MFDKLIYLEESVWNFWFKFLVQKLSSRAFQKRTHLDQSSGLREPISDGYAGILCLHCRALQFSNCKLFEWMQMYSKRKQFQ